MGRKNKHPMKRASTRAGGHNSSRSIANNDATGSGDAPTVTSGSDDDDDMDDITITDAAASAPTKSAPLTQPIESTEVTSARLKLAASHSSQVGGGGSKSSKKRRLISMKKRRLSNEAKTIDSSLSTNTDSEEEEEFDHDENDENDDMEDEDEVDGAVGLTQRDRRAKRKIKRASNQSTDASEEFDRGMRQGAEARKAAAEIMKQEFELLKAVIAKRAHEKEFEAEVQRRVDAKAPTVVPIVTTVTPTMVVEEKKKRSRSSSKDKKKKNKKKKRSSSSSSDSDSSSSSNDSDASSSSSSGSSSSDSDSSSTVKKLINPKRVTSMYRSHIQANTTTDGKGRQAEMRRLLLGAFIVGKYGKNEPAKALRWVAGYLTTGVKLLREFEANKSGELGTKIATIEKGLAKHCGKAGSKFKSKAKHWLPVPGVGIQNNNYSGGRSQTTTSFSSPNRGTYATRQNDKHEALQQMVNNLTAERTKSDQASAVTAEVQRVLSNHAASTTPSGFFPGVPQSSSLASSLPMGNQQFQPRTYGDRTQQKCFTCGQLNHQARNCPTTTGIPILTPIQTGVSQSDDEEGNDPERVHNTVQRHESNKLDSVVQRYTNIDTNALVRTSTTMSDTNANSHMVGMMPTDVMGMIVDTDTDDTLYSRGETQEEANTEAIYSGGEMHTPSPPSSSSSSSPYTQSIIPFMVTPPCGCDGTCGRCTHHVDLMPKEVRPRIAPTKHTITPVITTGSPPTGSSPTTTPAYLESHRLLINSIASFNNNIHPNPFQQQQSAEYESERSSDAWSVRGEGGDVEADEKENEDDDEEVTNVDSNHAYAYAGGSASHYCRTLPFGKKSFNPLKPGRECAFCKRKGHHTNSCMIIPPSPVLLMHPHMTSQQLAKQTFVIKLLKWDTQPQGIDGGIYRDADVSVFESNGAKLAYSKRVIERGDKANEGNPWLTSTKRRDKLRRCLGHWWAAGADRTIIGWIGFGVRLHPEDQPLPRMTFNNHRSYHQEVDHIRAEHALHVADGSFVETNESGVTIVNPLQVEVNAKMKRRMCVDSRPTNAGIASYQFTQETLGQHVSMIVQPNMVMITTDVEKAYYQVPLHKESQPLLAWSHDGKWIKPTILVFGLSVAPFIFTKIMRVLLRYMRSMGVRGTNCIDDNLWATKRGDMDEVRQVVQLMFGSLGWTFNAKCVFEPSTTVLYNGMWVDSERFEIRATDEKIEAVRKLAWAMWFKVLEQQPLKVKDIQVLTGRLMSLKLALDGVAVWTRGLYQDVTKAMKVCNQHIPSGYTILLSDEAIYDLHFWINRIGKQNGMPIRDDTTEAKVTIHSDASDLGWGATIDEGDTHIQFDGELPHALLDDSGSSTAREIRGLMLGMEAMIQHIEGKRVRIYMDSFPAIRNFINGGGSKPVLCSLVREFWIWCRKYHIIPLYTWKAREENTEADELSKIAAGSIPLRPNVEETIRRWLIKNGEPGMHINEYLQTTVRAPKFDMIEKRLTEMIRSRRPGCIILPRWHGIIWRAELIRHTKVTLVLGTMGETLIQPPHQHDNTWIMEAHIIIPELKHHSTQ
jgi:hypothetical protein